MVRNIAFQGEGRAGKKPLIYIPYTAIKFSLKDILLERRLFVSDIYLYRPDVDLLILRNFLSREAGRLASSVQSVRKPDINFFVKAMKLGLGPNVTGPVVSDFNVKISGYSFASSGKVRRGKLSFNYNFKASLSRTSLLLEKLELSGGGLFMQLWGSQENKVFKLNGFAFFHDALILDLDFIGEYSFNELNIERLKFSLNNNPLSVKGDIRFSGQPALDLFISSEAKGIKAEVKGRLKNNYFISNINFSSQRFFCVLNDLIFYYGQYPYLAASLKEASFIFKDNGNMHRLIFSRLNAFLDLKDEKVKYARFRSAFYGGRLDGKARLAVSRPQSGFSCILRIKNAKADELNTIFSYLSNIKGGLSSLIYFKNQPVLSLKAQTVVRNGTLENSGFLNWLSGYFSLPELKKIRFGILYFNTVLSPEEADFSDIRLTSGEIKLRGFFNLNRYGLVSSKLSLDFKAGLLQRSRKFTALLRMLGKRLNEVIFDFQLSGKLQSLNFQWLDSDFKRRLRRKIPDFIERGLDKKIESFVRSLQ